MKLARLCGVRCGIGRDEGLPSKAVLCGIEQVWLGDEGQYASDLGLLIERIGGLGH